MENLDLSGIGNEARGRLRIVEELLRGIRMSLADEASSLSPDQQARVAKLLQMAMEFVVFAQTAEESAAMEAAECLADLCREIATVLHG